METASEILKKYYWNHCSSTDITKDIIDNETTFIVEAMQQYSDSQNKSLLQEVEQLKKDKRESEMYKEITNDMLGLWSKRYDDEECGFHFKKRIKHFADKYQS